MRIPKKIAAIFLLSLSCSILKAASGNGFKDGLTYHLDDSGHFVKLTFLNQTWLRFNESNPATAIYNSPSTQTFDIGLRRTRLQLYGQLTDKVFFYVQFGQNNFNDVSARKSLTFFHDVTCEYSLYKKYISFGTGLNGWSGLARFASPSVGTILGIDAPLFIQATNDATDQFLRKLSIYAKGKLGSLDYRVALATPLAIQNSTVNNKIGKYNQSVFDTVPPKLQAQGYFMWQFFDKESNQLAYTTGTYLGNKKVFNVGGGFIYQPSAMMQSNNGVKQNSDLLLLAADVFYDAPVNKKRGDAISFYGGYFNYNFGAGYLRYNGVMNPANGFQSGYSLPSGNYGNAFAMIGTGQIIYAQTGYLLKNNLLKEGRLMPYASTTSAKYDMLKGRMNIYEVGLNYFVNGHNSKMTLGWQNRPVFNPGADTQLSETARKNMLVLQYQIFF